MDHQHSLISQVFSYSQSRYARETDSEPLPESDLELEEEYPIFNNFPAPPLPMPLTRPPTSIPTSVPQKFTPMPKVDMSSWPHESYIRDNTFLEELSYFYDYTSPKAYVWSAATTGAFILALGEARKAGLTTTARLDASRNQGKSRLWSFMRDLFCKNGLYLEVVHLTDSILDAKYKAELDTYKAYKKLAYTNFSGTGIEMDEHGQFHGPEELWERYLSRKGNHRDKWLQKKGMPAWAQYERAFEEDFATGEMAQQERRNYTAASQSLRNLESGSFHGRATNTPEPFTFFSQHELNDATPSVTTTLRPKTPTQDEFSQAALLTSPSMSRFKIIPSVEDTGKDTGSHSQLRGLQALPAQMKHGVKRRRETMSSRGKTMSTALDEVAGKAIKELETTFSTDPKMMERKMIKIILGLKLGREVELKLKEKMEDVWHQSTVIQFHEDGDEKGLREWLMSLLTSV